MLERSAAPRIEPSVDEPAAVAMPAPESHLLAVIEPAAVAPATWWTRVLAWLSSLFRTKERG